MAAGSLPNAAARIRAFVRAGGKIRFTMHARKEMLKDEVNEPDVRYGLRSCSVVSCELRGGQWRCTCRCHTRAGDCIEVPAVLEEPEESGKESTLTVISVFKVK